MFRKIIQIIVVLSVIALIGWGLSYVIQQGDDVRAGKSDWGIAKDAPIR